MPVKYIKASIPHIKLWSNITLIIGTILVIAFGAFAIRMQQGPMDLNFAKAKIESALSDSEKGYDLKIGNINLIWPEIIGPVLLDLKDVRIKQGEATALSVDSVALGLSGLHLFAGNILPSRVIVDGPAFHLVEEDGSFNFFWQKKKNNTEQADIEKKVERNPKEIREAVKDFFESITNTGAEKVEVLAALKRLEVKRAVITVTTKDDEKPRYLALADIYLKKNYSGVQGDVKITLPSAEGKESFLQSDILYRRSAKDLTFTAQVSDINPAQYSFLIPENNILKEQDIDLNGSVQAAFDKDFKLQLATLNLDIPKGKLLIPETYDEPIPLEDVVFEAHLNRPEGILDIKNIQGIVGKIPLQISAPGTIDKNVITAPVELKISSTEMADIAPIVPKAEHKSSIGRWLTYKLADGRLSDVVVTTDLTVTRNPETRERDVSVKNTKMTFKSENMTIKYSDTLMPVREANATGTYENDTLTVISDYGKVGDMVSNDVKLTITDLSVQGGGLADINIKANGPLKTALLYASDEPIDITDELGFDVDKVKGNLKSTIQLNFPTLKDLPKEEVKVDIQGTVTNLLLPNVVQGLPLTGGPYALTFKDGLISLKGSGELDKRPITLEWQQYLDPTGRDFETKVTAKITADNGLRDSFGIGLEDYISGPLPVDVTYIDKGVKATLDVTGSLEPTTLRIDPFDYIKEPGVAGEVSLKGIIKGDAIEEVDNLKVKTKGLEFSNGRILFKKLKDGSTDISRGAIPSISLGATKVSADFEITPANILKIVAKGDIVDLNPFINHDKKSDKWDKPKDKSKDRPLIVSVTADKMLAKDDESLRQSKIYMEANKGGDITRLEMDSKIGDGTMYLRFKPEEETGKRTFRMESTDAGYTLKAFGLYSKARGGKLTIYGQPAEGDMKGNLYGQARIDNFHVKSAPVLAKLLDAMSMNGVQNLLGNEGVAFQRLEANFEWQFHDGGNFLIIRDGRTSGSSMGLTFEGNVDQAKRDIAMSGTIVPISGVNNIVGSIPVIGDILTGGDALIAATYSIKGPTTDPKVSVNPLSVLAPGFLRKILFESAPEEAPQR